MSLQKWNFVQDPSKPGLSLGDVNYFRSSLDKILKVGAELEFNLPSTKGTCKGDNVGCGCRHLLTSDCWTKCLNEPFCSERKVIDECVNRVDTCQPEDCAACSLFKYECLGIHCSHFVSACHKCDAFEVDCVTCQLRYDPNRDPESIRRQLKQQLTPNNSYGVINTSGVHSIKKDGSLLGDKGAEIITIGRRTDYWEFYKMFKNIIDEATYRGAYMNERCSVHMHCLASYYDRMADGSSNGMKGPIPNYISELERSLPEIVVLNFHQLVRKYQNALTWMGMALEQQERCTRWEKFRISVLDTSPELTKSMKMIQNEVFSRSEGRKYGFINYQFLKFDDEGDVRTFHIEFRHLDGIMSPSALAAFACLWHAMIIKAVEISRYGLLEMESKEWYERALAMKEVILNGKGDYGGSRFGNTSNLKKYENSFREEAIDLVQQVKHILIQKGPAYEVLENIAREPLAYKRITGNSWKDIEEELAIPNVEDAAEEEFIKNVDELIDLRIVNNAEDVTTWINRVTEIICEEMGVSEIEATFMKISDYINNRRDEGTALWSSTLGSIITV